MPTFSVIVPAYKVQAFLAECLDSVLDQSYRDFELIAVDDASPDECGKILDEYAARDERVRVVHLPENVGLGGARNAGLARATGDRLLFLDGDDTLVPGTLEAIAHRLDQTGDPDIVIFDYARTYPSGGPPVRNARAAILAARGPEPCDVHNHPELLRLLPVAWNKAYSREWIERLGVSFPPGYYEDIAWTYSVLLSARSIALLDRVCVHYRQRAGGSILHTESRRHFDLFDQYERVFAFLDARPALDGLRPLLFGRMVDHVCAVLNMPWRVPPGTRREFFQRGTRLYRRLRPPGYTPPPGPPGVRYRLLGAGTPMLYQSLLHTRRVWLRMRALVARQLGADGPRIPSAHPGTASGDRAGQSSAAPAATRERPPTGKASPSPARESAGRTLPPR